MHLYLEYLAALFDEPRAAARRRRADQAVPALPEGHSDILRGALAEVRRQLAQCAYHFVAPGPLFGYVAAINAVKQVSVKPILGMPKAGSPGGRSPGGGAGGLRLVATPAAAARAGSSRPAAAEFSAAPPKRARADARGGLVGLAADE